MDQKQLQAEIAAQKLLVSACKENFRQAEFDLALLETEAEKPELTHGAFGLNANGLPFVIDGKAIRWMVDRGPSESPLEGNETMPKAIVFGNLTEPTALQEDLTSFKTDGVEFHVGATGCLVVTVPGQQFFIKDFSALILNLQKTRATHLRSKAK